MTLFLPPNVATVFGIESRKTVSAETEVSYEAKESMGFSGLNPAGRMDVFLF
jgi:hypothetical protein